MPRASACRVEVAALTPELEARVVEARRIATDEFGMTPGDVRFIMAPASVIYSVASNGLPGMWSHWSSGREYWLNKQEHDAGHSRIYEMVVNTRPYLALLHEANPDILNVMVAAHVYGHTHLNETNIYAADVNPHILDTVRVWAARVERYEEEYGDLEVEAFIDKVQSLEPYANAKFEGKAFKDEVIVEPPLSELLPTPMPVKPEKIFQPATDLFGFLSRYSEHLEDWQRDILDIYRHRTIYFEPQSRCKIIHEGFASIAHRRIMAKLDVTDAEWLEYSKINSGVMSPKPGGSINPYWLGHAILEDVEKRQGWQRLLEIVAVEDDASLIRNYLTEELCDKLDLFTFRFHPSEKLWRVDQEPKEWEVIRDSLVKKFDNLRSPTIEITDFDHDSKRGLLLTHRFDGRRLDMHHAEKALIAIADIWGQRAYLRTKLTQRAVEGVAFAPSERVERGAAADWDVVGE